MGRGFIWSVLKQTDSERNEKTWAWLQRGDLKRETEALITADVQWFEDQPETVLENDDYKLLRDYNIQTDHQISARRPDLVVINKQEQACQVIDIAVPEDTAVNAKEVEKLERNTGT